MAQYRCGVLQWDIWKRFKLWFVATARLRLRLLTRQAWLTLALADTSPLDPAPASPGLPVARVTPRARQMGIGTVGRGCKGVRLAAAAAQPETR